MLIYRLHEALDSTSREEDTAHLGRKDTLAQRGNFDLRGKNLAHISRSLSDLELRTKYPFFSREAGLNSEE